MEKVNISKKDIIWSYVAQFFSIASGLITLPLILKMLSPEEIGMNYLMLTIGSLVSLFDFGFAPQFGRNITYIFSGAQELKREGIGVNQGKINYRLLTAMIQVAKLIYKLLAMIVLLLLLTGGTVYIGKVTNGFTSIDKALVIWIVYSISVFFNVYYTYYTSLLIGKGLIMEVKKSMLASKFFCIILTFVFLFSGLGLLGVAIANLLAPFVSRFLSYRFFFTTELKSEISSYVISRKEELDLFRTIWYNAKKLGLVFIGNFGINKLSMFLAGLYLTLEDVASYGLMIQLIGVLTVISTTLFTVTEPHFAELRVNGQRDDLLKSFAFTMCVYYLFFLIGGICLVFVAPWCLSILGAHVTLPSYKILICYLIFILLENNHSNFATFIVTDNKIPFVESSLLAGAFIAFGSFVSLHYTALGILGLVLVQGLSQAAYANWKWPYVVCRDFKVSFISFLGIGLGEFNKKTKIYLYGRLSA